MHRARAGLAEQSRQPEAARWAQSLDSGHFVLLAYEVRTSPNPRATLLDFLESAY